MLWRIVGLSAACLTSFAFIPQVVKMFRTKSSKDVSCFTLVQLSCGVGLWIIYAAYLKDVIIFLANTITLITLIMALFLYCVYSDV